MLDITELTKEYNEFSLGPINLNLKTGLVYGLIGKNGSGKTTLFRNIMGAVRRDAGEIKVDGANAEQNTADWKNSIGYVGDYNPMYDGWSVLENVNAYSKFYTNWDRKKSLEMTGKFELSLTQQVGEFSTGQRQKLALVFALSHQAKLLLFDEPTSALDPIAREVFMDLLVEEIKGGDITVLYSTHNVNEIEKLADELIFIQAGKICNQTIKDDLTESWRTISFSCSQEIKTMPNLVSIKNIGNDYEALVESKDEALVFLENNTAVKGIEVNRLSLEQISVEILKLNGGK